MRSLEASGPVLGSIDDWAHQAPLSVAVEAGGEALTYEDLRARAADVAAHLPAGALVAVLAPRGAVLVVAALAARSAGSAYLALDPAYPDARLAWMLEDSRAAVVVTTPELAARVPPGGPLLVLDRAGRVAEPAVVERTAGPPPVGVDGAAYVVYTSGSTGTPKGVIVGAAGLEQLVAWHRRAFGLTDADRTSLLASPGFDASVWEIWPTLASGATLVVTPDDVRADPRRLRDWLVDAGITVGFVPTVLAEALITLPWPAATPLRYLLTGGDALHTSPPEGLPFTLVNNYGVSEATVVSTSAPVPPGSGIPSIGGPIDGTCLQVVDADLRPVPDGTPGELLIGGPGVALGYLGRPNLTEARFVPVAPGERWYRTGDLVRRRTDGQVEHLGRVDDQLSIRGVRIEPAEVVAALDAHPSVAASAVAADGDGPSRRLVAWVVPAASATDPEDLRAHLERRLPASMVPSPIVPVAALPLTAHGKVDRSALLAGLPDPRPARTADPVEGAGLEARADPGSLAGADAAGVTATIAGIVATLLGLPSVDPDEDFFLLGGHSMLGAELLGRLEDLFGVELSLRALFDGPTVAEIAASVRRAAAAGEHPGSPDPG